MPIDPQSAPAEADDDPMVRVTSIEAFPEYVIGFPVHIALTIQAPEGVWYKRLLFANLLNLFNCIGVEVLDAEGRVAKRDMPDPMIAPEAGIKPRRLDAGESRRMLCNVSPLLAGLTKGSYDLRFLYVAPRRPPEPVAAAPVRVRFRDPSPAEAATLASIAPDWERFPGWDRWTIIPPAVSPAWVPIGAEDPLRLNLILRYLFFGPEPLDQVDLHRLDALTGVYAPEREALLAELHLARGARAAFLQARAKILRGYPGLTWWMRKLDAGGGFLKDFRVEPAPAAKP